MRNEDTDGRFTVQTDISNFVDSTDVRKAIKEEHIYRLTKKMAEMLEEAPAIVARLEPMAIIPAPRTDSVVMRHELKIRRCTNCFDCKFAERSFMYPAFSRFCNKWKHEVPMNGFCHLGIPKTEEDKFTETIEWKKRIK